MPARICGLPIGYSSANAGAVDPRMASAVASIADARRGTMRNELMDLGTRRNHRLRRQCARRGSQKAERRWPDSSSRETPCKWYQEVMWVSHHIEPKVMLLRCKICLPVFASRFRVTEAGDT